jgi:hypothetical protein
LPPFLCCPGSSTTIDGNFGDLSAKNQARHGVSGKEYYRGD